MAVADVFPRVESDEERVGVDYLNMSDCGCKRRMWERTSTKQKVKKHISQGFGHDIQLKVRELCSERWSQNDRP